MRGVMRHPLHHTLWLGHQRWLVEVLQLVGFVILGKLRASRIVARLGDTLGVTVQMWKLWRICLIELFYRPRVLCNDAPLARSCDDARATLEPVRKWTLTLDERIIELNEGWWFRRNIIIVVHRARTRTNTRQTTRTVLISIFVAFVDAGLGPRLWWLLHLLRLYRQLIFLQWTFRLLTWAVSTTITTSLMQIDLIFSQNDFFLWFRTDQFLVSLLLPGLSYDRKRIHPWFLP